MSKIFGSLLGQDKNNMQSQTLRHWFTNVSTFFRHISAFVNPFRIYKYVNHGTVTIFDDRG